MTFDGALITEQGVTFAIIVVQSYVIDSSAEAKKMRSFGRQVFGNVPIILYDNSIYLGREDIVNFLSKIDSRRIPWKECTVS